MPFTTLITPQDLNDHLIDPNWVVVDCRFDLAKPEWGKNHYQLSHIPGAVYAHLDHDLAGQVTSKTGRHPLPEPKKFMACLSRWGIDSSKQVVAYDTSGGSMAARLWWLLRFYGHPAIAILDGGFPRWLDESRPVRIGIEENQPAHFTGNPDPGFFVTAEEVNRVREDPAYLVIDARAGIRYRGEEELIDPVAGHIPGAVNRFQGLNLDSHGSFLPPSLLQEQFKALIGKVPPEHVIVYCGSGVTACHHILAMEVAGMPGTRLYPGSWSEWIRDSNHLITTGDG